MRPPLIIKQMILVVLFYTFSGETRLLNTANLLTVPVRYARFNVPILAYYICYIV